MELANRNLPVIDWELGARLAGNNLDIANDLLSLLIKNLTQDLQVIKEHYAAEDYSALRQEIHKLHGAVAYCGVPRLKSILSLLESNLKNNIMTSLPSQMDQLETEIKQILEHPSQPV